MSSTITRVQRIYTLYVVDELEQEIAWESGNSGDHRYNGSRVVPSCVVRVIYIYNAVRMCVCCIVMRCFILYRITAARYNSVYTRVYAALYTIVVIFYAYITSLYSHYISSFISSRSLSELIVSSTTPCAARANPNTAKTIRRIRLKFSRPLRVHICTLKWKLWTAKR